MTSAVEIILADPALKAIFLLRNAARGGEAALVESKAARFLLWFALDGRRTYQHVAISPAFLGFSIGGACATTSLYGFVAAAPFIFVHELGRSTHEVGPYMAVLVLGQTGPPHH